MSSSKPMRGLLNFGVLLVLTMAYSAVTMLVAIVSPARGVMAVARVWSRQVTALCGVKIRTEGFEDVPRDRAFIVMPNHTSYFDVICLFATLPMPVRFVAKRELQLIPVFGWALALGAAIIIDRGNRKRAIASIERARRAVARGDSVLLFPEGTRTPEPGVLGPLKKGPFHLATGARVPVLPVGIRGTGAVLPKGGYLPKPGAVVVRAGEPIDTAVYADDDAGRAQLAKMVEEALNGLIRG